jgi:hypothetical protein
LTSRGMPTFMAYLPFAAGGGCRTTLNYIPSHYI